jgi:hypothetical protein
VENKKIVLATVIVVSAILLFGVYPFSIHDANFAKGQAMSMPPMSPSPSKQTTATPTPGTSNQALSMVIVAIVLVLVSLVALAVYFLYSKNKKRGAQHVYKSRSTEVSRVQPQSPVTKEEAKPFEVFLCYKKSSGKDYADHLKVGLEEVGLHTFEDCKDIPLTVTTEEGWARIRDQALSESKYFVLIMTQGFDLSSEVVKEIRMAKKQANKSFIFFRQRSMGRKIIVNLGDEILDIGQLEQVSFESKEELLRLAITILIDGKA